MDEFRALTALRVRDFHVTRKTWRRLPEQCRG